MTNNPDDEVREQCKECGFDVRDPSILRWWMSLNEEQRKGVLRDTRKDKRRVRTFTDAGITDI